MKVLQKRFTVPIYEADLWIVVTDDMSRARRQFDDLLGPDDCKLAERCDGLLCHSGGQTFALFIARKEITLNLLSHEVFHLTHRILEWTSANFDRDHHEQGALLHGYLMELVCREIGFKI